MRIDLDKLFLGEKIRSLTDREFRVYFYLWGLAVMDRTDVLSLARSQYRSLQGLCAISARSGVEGMGKVLEVLQSKSLIEILPSGRIKVNKVKEVHVKLHWDKCPDNVDYKDPI